MPKISSDKGLFFRLLGKQLNEEELDDLLFRFGIEAEEREEEPDQIYFEIAANRPDLLCIENLVHALRVYTGVEKKREYTFTPAKETIFVKQATAQVRPYVVAAILRNVNLTEDSFKSFLSFQDKIHQNYARKRTLVSIGTHDLDKIEGPYFYDARPPQELKFQALKQTEELNCVELFNRLREDQYLKGYLKIIENSPVYPVILDNKQRVCSLPPIINGEHSKMSAETKNILIEVTATDEQRALNTLNCLVSGFAIYNETLNIEKVNIVYEGTQRTIVTPIVDERVLTTNLAYINKVLGINISIIIKQLASQKASELLSIMGISSKAHENGTLECVVPYYRSDILQQCDIAEEIGIAYDYNKIEFKVPETATTGGEYRLNKLSDMIREEVAMCGFVECLNFVLLSIDEQTKNLNRPNIQNYVQLQNSKTPQFQSVRSTLIPGLMHTLSANSDGKLPIKLFEVGDVCIKGNKSEKDGFRKGEGQVGAYNQRNLVALHSSSKKSELEVLHGLVDQLMTKLRVNKTQYSLAKSEDPLFFHQLQAAIMYKGQQIGVMGVIHPEVLERYNWNYPVTLLEINVQTLINDF